MSTDCVFCRIVKGELSTYKIFDNEKTLAFLDAHPLAKGHTIVIPKIHTARLEDLGWEEAKALFNTSQIGREDSRRGRSAGQHSGFQ
jgi:diadenosine tetraphosphate (Ap4A) HIT family hydrolase